MPDWLQELFHELCKKLLTGKCDCEKVIAVNKKRLTDIEIKTRLRNGTLSFVKTPNDRRRVLNIARISELNVTTRESNGGFAVLYLNGGAK